MISPDIMVVYSRRVAGRVVPPYKPQPGMMVARLIVLPFWLSAAGLLWLLYKLLTLFKRR